MLASIDKTLREIIREEVQQALNEYKAQQQKESSLKRMTRTEFMNYASLSWQYITENIWYHPDFVPLRYKNGNKWIVSVAGIKWFDEVWRKEHDQS